MTTAREIADWHRAEAQRLKALPVHEMHYALSWDAGGSDGPYVSCEPAFDLTDRIKLHERFAAKVAELEKKFEASLILATELVLELKHYCKEPVHDSQLEELSRQRLALT